MGFGGNRILTTFYRTAYQRCQSIAPAVPSGNRTSAINGTFLAHFATLLNTLGMLLLLYGLLAILRARKDESVGESLSLFGLMAIAIFGICSVSSNGLIPIAVQRSVPLGPEHQPCVVPAFSFRWIQ